MNVHDASASPVEAAGNSDTTPPKSLAELSVLLAAQAPQLPKRLSQCARFVLDNPDAVALGTAAAVAQAAGVQPSTWVRFAQALGFSGFSELQEVCRTDLLGRSAPGGAAIRSFDPSTKTGSTGVLSIFAEHGRVALASLAESMDEDAFDDAVRRIVSAATIHILGLRRSFPVAAYLYYALNKVGKRCVILDNLGGMLSDRTDTIGAEDVLLIITFHPYAPEVAEFAEVVSQSGRTVIAITDSPLSPAAGLAENTLFVRDPEVGGFRALSATMSLASSLAMAASLSLEASLES